MSSFNANHLICFDTLRGGLAISNPIVREPGTLGFVATADGSDRWIVSCYHVLCRPLSAVSLPNPDEPIYYHFDGRTVPVPIAVVKRHNATFDCAAALATSPTFNEVLGVGRIKSTFIKPVVGMRVLKSGISSGVTEGIVTDLTDGRTIRVESPDLRTDYALCAPGDSGALYVDAESLRPVALHTGGDRADEFRVATATPIDLVLQSLRLRLFD